MTYSAPPSWRAMADGPSSAVRVLAAGVRRLPALDEEPLLTEPAKCMQRLAGAVAYAMTRPEEGATVPERPKEVDEWIALSGNGVLIGVTYGALKQYLEEMRADAYLKAAAEQTRTSAKDLAEANTRKLVRLYSRAIGGGASIGAFAAAFFGLEFVLATARARPGDPLNTALGGAIVCGGTAAALGIGAGAGAAGRVAAAAAASTAGAAVGWPTGHGRALVRDWKQALTQAELEERHAAAAGSGDAVERVIASLEAQVADAEATLAAVRNAEEKAKPSWWRRLLGL